MEQQHRRSGQMKKFAAWKDSGLCGNVVGDSRLKFSLTSTWKEQFYIDKWEEISMAQFLTQRLFYLFSFPSRSSSNSDFSVGIFFRSALACVGIGVCIFIDS